MPALASVVNWLLEQIFESNQQAGLRPNRVVNWLLEQIFESFTICLCAATNVVNWLLEQIFESIGATAMSDYRL